MATSQQAPQKSEAPDVRTVLSNKTNIVIPNVNKMHYIFANSIRTPFWTTRTAFWNNERSKYHTILLSAKEHLITAIDKAFKVSANGNNIYQLIGRHVNVSANKKSLTVPDNLTTKLLGYNLMHHFFCNRDSDFSSGLYECIDFNDIFNKIKNNHTAFENDPKAFIETTIKNMIAKMEMNLLDGVIRAHKLHSSSSVLDSLTK